MSIVATRRNPPQTERLLSLCERALLACEAAQEFDGVSAELSDHLRGLRCNLDVARADVESSLIPNASTERPVRLAPVCSFATAVNRVVQLLGLIVAVCDGFDDDTAWAIGYNAKLARALIGREVARDRAELLCAS